ncbi:unnamed protein product [Closterium sp. NIES-53]
MRLCSVSRDLELLSAILQRTSCPPVPFPASSLASPLTHPGGSSTTPPRVVFCPLRTSCLTSTPPVDPLPPQGPAADKLPSRAVPCIFLGFPPDAPRWQFYHPTSRRVLSSQDIMFDESVSYYCVSQVDPAKPVEVPVDSGAARGAEPAGAGTGDAEPWGAEPERVEPRGAESGRAEPRGAERERVEPGGTASGGAEPARAESGGSPGVPSRREPLSPQQLREWYAQRCRGAAGVVGAGGIAGAAGGAAGAGAAGAAGGTSGAAGGATSAGAPRGAARAAGGTSGAARGATGAGAPGGAAGAAGGTSRAARGAPTGGTGAAGTGGAAGVVARDPGAEGAGVVSAVSGGAARPRPYYVPLLQQVLGLPPSPGPPSPLLSPPPPESRPVSPESRPASTEPRSASPFRTVRAGRRVSRPRPPLVPVTC